MWSPASVMLSQSVSKVSYGVLPILVVGVSRGLQHYYAFRPSSVATSVKKAESSLQSVYSCIFRVRRPGTASIGAQLGERRRVPRFALEALDELPVAGIFAFQRFRRHVAVELLVLPGKLRPSSAN